MRARISFGIAFLVLTACGTNREATAPLSNSPGVEHLIVTAPACGDQISNDVRLDVDLTCSGDALTIVADNITINLNGHEVAGNGTGVGITLRQRSGVTIKGGAVRNFLTGIFVSQSTDVTVKDNSLTLNREAIFLIGSSHNVVKSNVAWDNTQRGIMLRPTMAGVVSTDNMVVDNVLMNNPSGILVFGQSGNTFKGNSIYFSTVGAFDLTGGGGTGNEMKENLLTGSAAGIKFGPGWTTGNSIIGNTFSSNTCGTAGSGASNTYKDNIFSSNTTDICP
jgi:parallel beta-helix repeat protein